MNRAKYGNGLIKEWSAQFTEKYGSGYDATNLSRFRQFYIYFPILDTVCQELSWSHIRKIIGMKEENKRNYYINLCLKRELSVRELEREIKNNSYERLVNKPERIKIIPLKRQPFLLDAIQNPILLEFDSNKELNNEKELELLILAQLKNFFFQLGEGFTFAGNQY